MKTINRKFRENNWTMTVKVDNVKGSIGMTSTHDNDKDGKITVMMSGLSAWGMLTAVDAFVDVVGWNTQNYLPVIFSAIRDASVWGSEDPKWVDRTQEIIIKHRIG